MSAIDYDAPLNIEFTVKGTRMWRSYRISEAAALRLLQYRNGFKLHYRCCCVSPAWRPRIKRACPWWAFPRCRGALHEYRAGLVKAINVRRSS